MNYKASEILDVAMEVGINLLRCGAEIRRVEDTITYISKAYGASEVDVFAIPTLIIATILFAFQIYCDFYSYSLIVHYLYVVEVYQNKELYEDC